MLPRQVVLIVPLDKSLGITLANWDQTHARKNSMSHLYVQ